MIINRCDICKKDVAHLDSIVLYKKSFDYCINCKMEAEKIQKEFKKEYDCAYAILDCSLVTKERQYLYDINNKNAERLSIKEE